MSDPRLFRWQTLTLATLFSGYVGYYICRSNLSVVTPLLTAPGNEWGLTKVHIGWVQSVGVLFYAFGKVTNGLTADYRGGRKLFLIGMFGSVLCTLAFAIAPSMIGAAGFTILVSGLILIWAANRYIQSMGWVALVKIASRWFPPSFHARAMGILSMSFLLGDAFARFVLGTAIELEFSWQGVFYLAALLLALLWLFAWWALRETPTDLKLPEPPSNATHVYSDTSPEEDSPSLWKHVRPLLSSRALLMICILNFGLTVVRETFNTWSPSFLVDVGELTAGNAAVSSLFFPLVGALAAAIAGVACDRLGNRGRFIVPMLVLLVAVLASMGWAPIQGRPLMAILFLAASAFTLMTVYTLLSGVIALDLGGKQGCSTASGFIDSAGYLGGVFAGVGFGTIAERAGWPTAFTTLAVITGVTACAGVVYWWFQESSPPDSQQPPLA